MGHRKSSGLSYCFKIGIHKGFFRLSTSEEKITLFFSLILCNVSIAENLSNVDVNF